MSGSLPEKDWKYLRSIEAELLSELCRKINQRTAQLLNSEYESEHKKYLTIYKHIETSDKIVADCFNNWSRSNLLLIVPLLHRLDLLKDKHILNLSDVARELLDRIASL